MHGWRLPLGKICLSFKTMKNIKIADSVLAMNSSHHEQLRLRLFFTKKKLRYHSESKIRSHHGWLTETKLFLLCLSLFLY